MILFLTALNGVLAAYCGASIGMGMAIGFSVGVAVYGLPRCGR